jgi:putative intracellular protease/amidase
MSKSNEIDTANSKWTPNPPTREGDALESETTKIEAAHYSRRDLLALSAMAAMFAATSSTRPIGARAGEATFQEGPLQLLFVLYPKFTLQDFAGANEILARLPNVKVIIASPDGGAIVSDTGVTLSQTVKLSDIKSCDLLCVTGGSDHSAMTRPDVQDDLRRLSSAAKYVTSVCNGALILGAAGVLKGHRSACYWAQLSLLKQYGAIADPARIVKDGRYISGSGVTAGLDFALAVAAELRGPVSAQMIQLLIEYAPQPPFNAGRRDTAPPEVIAAFKQRYPGLAATAGL